MTFKQQRRFIAGAVCPRCSKMDTIVVFNEEGKDFRECVECGYKNEMHFQQQVRELETRVNVTEDAIQEETQVLKFPPLENDTAPSTTDKGTEVTGDKTPAE